MAGMHANKQENVSCRFREILTDITPLRYDEDRKEEGGEADNTIVLRCVSQTCFTCILSGKQAQECKKWNEKREKACLMLWMRREMRNFAHGKGKMENPKIQDEHGEWTLLVRARKDFKSRIG